MTRPPGRSTTSPGAVPLSFGIDTAEGISHACFRFASGKGSVRRSNSSRSQASSAGIHRRRLADEPGDRLPRQVVGRRPEPAGRDDELGALERLAERRSHRVEVVGQRRDPADDDAPACQVARQIARVRVSRLADRELGPDREQLGGPDRLHGGAA